MKEALATGISGQDGSYLAEFLSEHGYEVHRVARSASNLPEALGGRLASSSLADLLELKLCSDIVPTVRRHETNHLAAHHFSSQGSENRTGQLYPLVAVDLMAADAALDVLRNDLLGSPFLNARSAHIFAGLKISTQVEDMRHEPDTPYLISKSAGVHPGRYCCQAHSVYGSAGSL